ncbi:MAG TPA: single-stranded DNA-binding protein [Flavobacteriales bacterium]|nr:single-stranded DNA-binding protein [Flavobacteriales bacterium]
METMENTEKMIRNRVQLMGNLGKDPDVREYDGGKKMARFSLATNERFPYGDGQFKEDTQWHGIVAWGRLAEQVAQQLKKGSRVSLQGRLVHRTYETKDGQKRYSTEVVLGSFEPMDGRGEVADAA